MKQVIGKDGKARSEAVGIAPGEYVEKVAAGKGAEADALIEQHIENYAIKASQQAEVAEKTDSKPALSGIDKIKENIRVNDTGLVIAEIRDKLICEAFQVDMETLGRGKDLIAKQEEENSKIDDQLLHDQHALGQRLKDKENRVSGKYGAIAREQNKRKGLGALKLVGTTGASVGTTLGGIALGLAAGPAALLGGASALGVGAISLFIESKISKKREKGNLADANLDQKDYEDDLKLFIAEVEKIEAKIKTRMPEFLEKQKVMKEDVFKDYVKAELIELFGDLGISVGEAAKNESKKAQKQAAGQEKKTDKKTGKKKEENEQQAENEEAKAGLGG